MQPIEYKSEQELLNWLSNDLKEQRIILANKNKIKIEDVKESDLILNIGMKDKTKINEKYSHVMDFDFNFETIIDYFNIDKNNIEYKINFNKIFFKGNINFIDIKFNNEFEFTHSYSKNKILFIQVKFKNIVDFSFSNINDITFNKIIFYGQSFFSNASFDNISFCQVKFTKSIEMEESEIYYIYFTNIKFIKNAIFNKTIFYETTNFNYVIFNKNVSLKNSHFQKEIIFQKVKFNNIANFSGTYIEKNIKLSELTINKNTILIFNNLHLNGINSSLSISNCKNIIENIKLKDILLTDLRKIELRNIRVNKLNLKGSVINGGLINTVNLKVHKFANRESALFLKQQAYAANNAIDALEYKAKEVEKHKEDLIKDWKKDKNLKTFGDILSIELSSLYSDNGQNWIKAFICTILFPMAFFTLSSYINFNVGLCFYILSIAYTINILFFKDILKYIINSILVYLIACLLLPLLYIEISNLDKSYIKELFIFLIPTNFEQIKDSLYIYNDNTFFRGFNYFIGKIAFWYGSVQTVQAFRKFAKGA